MKLRGGGLFYDIYIQCIKVEDCSGFIMLIGKSQLYSESTQQRVLKSDLDSE